jgi:hypothetical protein
MSDFLSRLVGRSLGPSRAVQPRVPSLYEPYIKGRGPVWTRHAGQEQDPSRESQDRQPQDEDRRDLDSNSEEDNRGRTEEPLRRTRLAQRAAFVNEAQPAVVSLPARPLEPAGAVPPAVAQMREKNVSRVEVPHERRAENAARVAVTDRKQASLLAARLRPQNATTTGEDNPSGTPFIVSTDVSANLAERVSANDPLSLESSRPMQFTSLHPPASVNPATGNDAASKFEIENAGKPVAERRSARLIDPSRIVKPANATPAILGNSPVPSLFPTASMAAPVTATPAATPAVLAVPSVRRQGRQASDLGNVHATVRNAATAEPAVRVSIGRVEVRAVFPAPPVRRVQPARPKPGLSLDDYLKRPKRGQQ